MNRLTFKACIFLILILSCTSCSIFLNNGPENTDTRESIIESNPRNKNNVMVAAKLDPHSNEWETVPNSWKLIYNPYKKSWVYGPSDSILKHNQYNGEWEVAGSDWTLFFNPHDKVWEFAPKNATSKYNPYSSKWESVGEDWVLSFNPYLNKWKYLPPE